MTARYGSRGGWALLVDAVTLGWLVGVITFAALMLNRAPDRRSAERDRASDQHWAAVARWLLWSTLPVFCLREIGLHWLLRYGFDRWGALFISAWLVVLIGLQLVASTPERLRGALQRLHERGLLPESVTAVDAIERDLERSAHRGALLGGLIVPVAVLLAEGLLSGLLSALPHWRTWLVSPFGAYLILNVIASSVVGAWIGRMAGYGRLGHVLAERGFELRVVPDHPDGAGGLRPIGAFYLYQSLMASLPAVFLIIWGLLFWLWHAYQALGGYLSLLALAILAEALVGVRPMISVHASMREQKNAFLASADEKSRKFETVQARLKDAEGEERDALMRELAVLVEQFQTLEKAPTWPMDQSLRRLITLQNVVLLLPLVGSLWALLKRLG